MSRLEAAAASVDITPELGVPSPAGRVEAVEGPLRAGLVVFRSGGRSIVWVTLNQATLSPEYDQALAHTVGSAVGVPELAVVLGCTRNLSSPLSFGGANAADPGAPRLPYHDRVIAALGRAAAEAAGALALCGRDASRAAV